MRREPEQRTVREGRHEEPKHKMPEHEAHRHRMEGYREGLRHGHMDAMNMRRDVQNPGDPERKKGDGINAAFKQKPGTERGKPTKAGDPEKKRGDGMKVAMRGEAGKQSKLSPMGAAERAVR